MLQGLANWFKKTPAAIIHSFWHVEEKPIVIPITDKNVMIITAFVKKGVITVSYKGQTRRGLFEDSTLHNMVKGIRFDKSVNSFLGALAKLIEQVIKK